MQLHIRGFLSGTLITKNTKLEKFDLKTDSTLSAGVYPAWHPSLDLIAYSVNLIHQNFHTTDTEKTEVQDRKSGLILYDIRKNEVRTIIDGRDDLETFPSWAPDGRHIVFESTRTGTRQIWTMLADGSDPHQITTKGGNWNPNWSN